MCELGSWANFFYLLHTHSLNDLAEFIKVASGGLSVDVPEGDYNTLVGVMHHLLAVKDRQPNTDGMFEPLNQTIELLKTYHEEMPEQVYQQLEVQCMDPRPYRTIHCHDVRSCPSCGTT